MKIKGKGNEGIIKLPIKDQLQNFLFVHGIHFQVDDFQSRRKMQLYKLNHYTISLI